MMNTVIGRSPQNLRRVCLITWVRIEVILGKKTLAKIGERNLMMIYGLFNKSNWMRSRRSWRHNIKSTTA